MVWLYRDREGILQVFSLVEVGFGRDLHALKILGKTHVFILSLISNWYLTETLTPSNQSLPTEIKKTLRGKERTKGKKKNNKSYNLD